FKNNYNEIWFRDPRLHRCRCLSGDNNDGDSDFHCRNRDWISHKFRNFELRCLHYFCRWFNINHQPSEWFCGNSWQEYDYYVGYQ
ncbi:hypothetical protein HDU82_004045, partial [Entophlyctis luteolus]